MKKARYKKSIVALFVVLMYLIISVASAKILPLAVLQDLTNSNIIRRILYDAKMLFATSKIESEKQEIATVRQTWIYLMGSNCQFAVPLNQFVQSLLIMIGNAGKTLMEVL